MTGLLGNPDALLAAVVRDARHQAIQRAEAASRATAALTAQAEAEAAALRQTAAARDEREAAALERRHAAQAELAARRRFLELRELPIERVWAAAEARLRALAASPAYLDQLRRCALRAAAELAADAIALSADPAAHARLTPALLAEWSQAAGTRFTAAAAPAAIWGGLLAVSGRLRCDAAYPARLASARATLRAQVHTILAQPDASRAGARAHHEVAHDGAA